MRYVETGVAGLRVSILGFGCAPVMGRVGRRDSLRAISAAFDAGVNFFDTARSYGYGESEAVLGEFLAGRRDKALVSTKFGILPTRQQAWKKVAKPIARKIFSICPGVRQAARRHIAGQFLGNQFSVKALRLSLEQSLRQLRTDYVDFLFMHTPPLNALYNQELLDEMINLVGAGKVRVIGVSTRLEESTAEIAIRQPEFKALQFPCNLRNAAQWRRVEHFGSRVVAANLPFGGIDGFKFTRARVSELQKLTDKPASIGEKLTAKDDASLADVVLNLITRNTGVHVVLPSMMQLAHLRANLDAITKSRFSDTEIAWLRNSLYALREENENAGPKELQI